jgi:hypothetical protein
MSLSARFLQCHILPGSWELRAGGSAGATHGLQPLGKGIHANVIHDIWRLVGIYTTTRQWHDGRDENPEVAVQSKVPPSIESRQFGR